MTPAELMATRESLGLNCDAAASLVGVSARVWRSWETGRTWQVRAGVPVAVVDVLTRLRGAVSRHVGEYRDQGDEVLVCYRDDQALRAAHPGAVLPAVTYLLAQALVVDRIALDHRRKPPRLVWSDLRAGDRGVVLDGHDPRVQATLTSAEFVAYRVQLGISQNWFATAVGVMDKTIYEWGTGAQRIPREVAMFVLALLADVERAVHPGIARQRYWDITEPITLLCSRDTHQVTYHPGSRARELPPPAHRAAQLRIAHALRGGGHTVALDWAPLEPRDL